MQKRFFSKQHVDKKACCKRQKSLQESKETCVHNYIIVIIMTIVKYVIIFYPIRKGGGLLISFDPFWKTLKKKRISTYVLIKKYNISSATIARMKKGDGISTMKIDDFCRILDCNVEDIIQYRPDP